MPPVWDAELFSSFSPHFCSNLIFILLLFCFFDMPLIVWVEWPERLVEGGRVVGLSFGWADVSLGYSHYVNADTYVYVHFVRSEEDVWPYLVSPMYSLSNIYLGLARVSLGYSEAGMGIKEYESSGPRSLLYNIFGAQGQNLFTTLGLWLGRHLYIMSGMSLAGEKHMFLLRLLPTLLL